MIAMFFVVTSGAFVRLTASGLGCDHWPRCGTAPFPTEGNQHAIIEFSNRLVAVVGIGFALATWLAARRVAGLSSLARWSALGALVGALAQIPLGGLTIRLHLHPLAVMSHFLLALIVLALSVLVVVEAWSSARGGRGRSTRPGSGMSSSGGPASCRSTRGHGRRRDGVGAASGAQKGVERLGVGITDTVYVHVRVAAAFGIGFLVLGFVLLRVRNAYPGLFRLWIGALLVLVAQSILGEVQYRNALPWGLVLVHVFLAATIWALAVALTAALWRHRRRSPGPPRRGRPRNPPHSGRQFASKVSGWKAVPTCESTSGPPCAARC